MFWHHLALALGMTVREAMERISEEEFRYWLAFDKISPISKDRDDFLAAMVTTATMQPHTKQTLRVSDSMPEWGKKPGMTGNEMEMTMTHFAARNNRAQQ